MADTAIGTKTCRNCPFLDEASAWEWGDYGCNVSEEVSSEMKHSQIEAGVPSECPLRQGPIAVVYVGDDS